MIDRQRLRELVHASGYKQKYLAQALGISPGALQNKLAGRSEFKLGEAQRLSFLLGLSPEEQARCFWRLR